MKKLSLLTLALSLVTAAGAAFAQPPSDARGPQRGACEGRRRGQRGERQAAEAGGTVARFVEGRAGRTRGFALDDGTLVRSRRAGEVLRVGQPVRVSGYTFGDATRRMIVRATVRGARGDVVLEPPARGEGRGHRGGHDRGGAR